MKFETRREREQRLRRQKRSNRIGMLLAFALVAVIGIALLSSKRLLEKRNIGYEAQIQELQTQIEEQQKKSDDLDQYKKYIQTKKFVEDMAKDKFGLIYPDELIFKPEK
jgi:cell division protein FtsB